MVKKTFANEQEAAEYLCASLGESLEGMDYVQEESAYFVHTKTQRTYKDTNGKRLTAGDPKNYYYISVNSKGEAFVREEIGFEKYSDKEEMTEFVDRVKKELQDTFDSDLLFDSWK